MRFVKQGTEIMTSSEKNIFLPNPAAPVFGISSSQPNHSLWGIPSVQAAATGLGIPSMQLAATGLGIPSVQAAATGFGNSSAQYESARKPQSGVRRTQKINQKSGSIDADHGMFGSIPTRNAFSFKLKPSNELDITNKDWKFLLPDQVLEQLRCSFCMNYMSHLPIYLYPEQQQISCGRCTVSSNQNPIQLVSYEAIAKFLFFPCQYKLNGCIERLQPNEIPAHEESCSYKQYLCPSYPTASCNWQGYGIELYAHYEAEHKNLILDSRCQFDIDLTNEHKQNYLIMKNSELFIIHIDSDSQVFRGSVSYFSNKDRTQQYYYGFRFEESNYSITPHEKKDVEYGLIMDFDKRSDVCVKIHNVNLMNLSCAICFVSISPHTNSGIDSCAINSTANEDTFEDKLLSELECPCCMEPMIPPIYQCQKGHSICNRCIKTNHKCLTCSVPFHGDLRNFTLEKITTLISKYPCKYSKYGCVFTSKAESKPVHEESCLYLSYTCPLEADKGCNWEGTLSAILEHAKIKHAEDVLNINVIQSIYSEDKPDCYIYNLFGQLFRLMVKYEKQQFFWSVQFIGPPNDSSKFMYMLDFIDNNRSNQRCIIKQKCSPLTNYANTFDDEGSYICIPVNLLKRFVDENCITYKFSVVTC